MNTPDPRKQDPPNEPSPLRAHEMLISLDEDEYRQLQKLAEKLGCEPAAVLRQGLQLLTEEEGDSGPDR